MDDWLGSAFSDDIEDNKENSQNVAANNVTVSGMSSNQIAEKLYSYIDQDETQKFAVMLESINTKDSKWDLNNILGKWTHKKDNLNILHKCVTSNSIEIAQLLFEKYNKFMKINNTSHNSTRTALVEACDQNSSDMVKLLMNNGADPNIIDKSENVTTLYAASKHGNKNIMQILLNDSNKNKIEFNWDKLINTQATRYGDTVFHQCCVNGSLDCLKYLFEIENDKIKTGKWKTRIDIMQRTRTRSMFGLLWAVYCDRTDTVKYLLNHIYNVDNKQQQQQEQQLDINHVDQSGQSCLWHAAANGNVELIKLIYNKYKNVCDINQCSSGQKKSPLWIACNFNRTNCVEWFINNPQCQVNLAAALNEDAPKEQHVECFCLLFVVFLDCFFFVF